MRYVLIFFVLIAFGCSNDEPKTTVEPYTGPIPESMKGYELYSWPEGNAWKFTLITGTNRNKTYQEITAPEDIASSSFIKVTVRDVPALKELLNRVPAEQFISWSTHAVRVAGFSMPPADIRDDIKAHCASLRLNLSVGE